MVATYSLKERDVETALDYFNARYYSSIQGRFTSLDEFKGGPEELFGEVDPHDPLFYADTADPQSLNKYHYCLNNPLRYVDPDGHQTTVSDRIRNAASRVSEVVATVARAAEPVINGASSALAEDNGLGPNPGPQSSVGRGVGHGIALAQSAAEVVVGVSAAVGGGTEAVATSPAVVTVVGTAVPATGVVVAVAGVVTAAHGALVGANTLHNIFNKNNAGSQSTRQPAGQTSAGRPTDQHGRPLGPSGKPMIHQVNPGSQKRAKDAARNAGQGAPMKHTNPQRGQDHYHPTDRKGRKIPDGTHYNYD